MRRNLSFTFSFIVSLLVIAILFFTKETPPIQFLQKTVLTVASPVRGVAYSAILSLPWMKGSREEKLRNEITELKKKIAAQELLKKDIAALKDQFAASQVNAAALLPARIIGAPTFIPNVSLPEHIVIDKGEKDGVSVGLGVVVNDVAVGKIIRISNAHAVVELATSRTFSLPVKTARTGALGVITGKGGKEMVLGNVLLSEEIAVDDMVVTFANQDEETKGFPPGFFVGKITSVDKQPSAIFQKASLKTLIDVTKQPFVFVLLGNE